MPPPYVKQVTDRAHVYNRVNIVYLKCLCKLRKIAKMLRKNFCLCY